MVLTSHSAVVRTLGLTFAVSLLAYCSESEPERESCQEGATEVCRCPDGTESQRHCGADGHFGDCLCTTFVVDAGDTAAVDSGDGSVSADTDDEETLEDLGGDDDPGDSADTDWGAEDAQAGDTSELSDGLAEPDVDEEPDVDADGDAEADADAGLCPVSLRCASRVVEECEPATGGFSELEVCDRTERCVDGLCEPLPDAYGQPCRTEADSRACTAADLKCGGLAALLFCVHPEAPRSDGEPCFGSRDCVFGSLCTLDGYCSSGDVGEACRDDDDCTGALVCGDDGTCRSPE